jgi:hypothetical protein
MTNVPEPQALAEAARRYAIATVRTQLDEIVEHTRRVKTSEPGLDPPWIAETSDPGGLSSPRGNRRIQAAPRPGDKLMKAFLGPEVFEGTVVVAGTRTAPAGEQLELARELL